jgi:hypothetical protein
MRGWDARSDALFSYVSCEARVPKDHPLRSIRRIVDEALAALSPQFIEEVFGWTRARPAFARPITEVWPVSAGCTLIPRLQSHSPANWWRSRPDHVRNLFRQGRTNKNRRNALRTELYWTTYERVSHDGSTFCSAVTEVFRTLLVDRI